MPSLWFLEGRGWDVEREAVAGRLQRLSDLWLAGEAPVVLSWLWLRSSLSGGSVLLYSEDPDFSLSNDL